MQNSTKFKFPYDTHNSEQVNGEYKSTYSKNRDHLNIVTRPFHSGEKHTNSTG